MTRKEYLKFFNAVAEVIDFFVEIHKMCEELYISGELEFDDDPGGD